MELVTIYTALDSGDAQLVRSRLDSAGFHPFIKSETDPLNTLSAGGIKVQVPADEQAEAKEFLDSPAE